jgi:aryl-alcohol dehydrogenase-like predicted oxidoreductase
MEYRNLGTSGLRVSVVGLGCNNFGQRCDPAQTKAVVHKSLDVGINLFDTADMYGGGGPSEEYLGQALGSRRHDIVLATKFGAPMSERDDMKGASRRYINAALEASLKRLGTDYIDLYQLHFPDPRTPIEETLRALDDLVRAGKVRYIGCSNLPGWEVAEAHWCARHHNLNAFVSVQDEYSLLVRQAEAELLPAARAYGLGVLPYFPLAGGMLTGKHRRGQAPAAGTRLALVEPMADKYMGEASFDLLESLTAFAEARDHSMLELAFGWLASQANVASVIAGAMSPEQVEQNAVACDWRLSAEELAEVDKLLAPAA